MIMKKYENPMLQIVSINKNDIITGSSSATVGTQNFEFYGTTVEEGI